MSVAEISKPPPAPIPHGKYKIIDADAHIDPPHTFWADYLPAHLKVIGPTADKPSCSAATQ